MLKCNIEKVEFILENTESMIIPYESFEYFKLSKTTFEKEYNLECRIIKQDNIDYGSFGFYSLSPLQRIHEFNDIVAVRVTTTDGFHKRYDIIWDVTNFQDNSLQKTTLYNFNDLEINIREDNYYKCDIKEKHKKMIEEMLDDYDKMENCEKCWYEQQCKEGYLAICNALSLLKDLLDDK